MPLHLDRLVTTGFNFLTPFLELGNLSLGHRAPRHIEPALLRHATDVDKAEEVEGFRFLLPSLAPAFSRIPPEFYQSRLVAMELQGEFGQPFL